MSDLLTPLHWAPSERDTLAGGLGARRSQHAPLGDEHSADDKPRHPMFAWPTPPFATYPNRVEQRQPEACEIVGLNGTRMHGRLIFFVPDESVAHVQVPPARTTMALRFKQFKSLTVLPPVHPAAFDPAASPGGAARAGDALAPMLAHRPRSEYCVALASGGELRGETIGHVESPYGLFLFPPIGDGGSVQRLFIPRQAYAGVELGPRIGDVLLAENTATPLQIARAVEQQQQMRTQRIGDLLVTRHLLTPDQLLGAIEQQAKMPMVRIGEALTSLGLVTQAQIDEALAQQQHDRSVPLGQLLVRMGAVSREDLQVALARKMGYPR